MMPIIDEGLKYYEAFIDEPNNCYRLIEASLSECYHWLSQSFEESKSIACSFRDLINGYEISCLSDLVKASIEVREGNVEISFRGLNKITKLFLLPSESIQKAK
jgi:hypothetical protein